MNNIEERSMLPVGTLLQGGKYRVERYLSSGGFGNTYVATNTEFDEQVAIKEFFMRGISQRDGDSVSVSVSNETNVTQFTSQKEKFRKEARRLRKLRNNHIVAVHDLFEENGTAYYEMDLIKGESLNEKLKRTGQPLTETEVMRILNQVLDALAVVHEQGLYHLDLKPANIMIDQAGRALLIDFGASKQMSSNEGFSISTSSALAFTPGYAPLEQTEQNLKSFGPWTDIYALGATLYKLLTNLTPPSASELLVSRTPLLFPSPVGSRMQQLIAWMMKPAYVDRPQNVADIKRFLEGKPKDDETIVGEKPDSPSERTKTIATSYQKARQQSIQSTVISQRSTKQNSINTPEPTEEHSFVRNKLLWGIGIGVAAIAMVVVFILLLKGPAMVNAVTDTIEQVMGEQVNNISYTSPVKGGMGTYQYSGSIDDQGRPHGKGKAEFANGDSYEGPFVQGVMKGEDARYKFHSGESFEGVMDNDEFVEGTYTLIDGSYFKGSFYKGQPESGTWYDKNGTKLDDM